MAHLHGKERGKELEEVGGRCEDPPVRLVRTGLTGAERRDGSVCVTGLHGESGRENATPLA